MLLLERLSASNIWTRFVHNSELSWSKKKINSPDEVLELNKTYDFKVLSVNREEGKISLGYKQLQPKPEEIALTKYPVGSVLKGKVVRLVKFGAFVELEPGIDGLVHVSQINHGWIKSPNEALKVGDEVEVKVIGIDNDRITLSIKELLPEEPVAEALQPKKTAPKQKTIKLERKGRKQKKRKRPENIYPLQAWLPWAIYSVRSTCKSNKQKPPNGGFC